MEGTSRKYAELIVYERAIEIDTDRYVHILLEKLHAWGIEWWLAVSLKISISQLLKTTENGLSARHLIGRNARIHNEKSRNPEDKFLNFNFTVQEYKFKWQYSQGSSLVTFPISKQKLCMLKNIDFFDSNYTKWS